MRHHNYSVIRITYFHVLWSRLCWSLVTRTSCWDVLQRLKRLPASSPVLPAVLARLDNALHCERYTPRPAYSMLLAALKLQLLTGSPDPTAQSVSQVSVASKQSSCVQRALQPCQHLRGGDSQRHV